MEYYAQAQRSASSFAAGFRVSDSDPGGGFVLSSPLLHEDWPIQHAVPSAAIPMADAGIDEGMWQLNLHPSEGMEPGPAYPERPGEPDCVYYLRTGLCGFGMSCRFNHPRNRQPAAVTGRGRGEYPERVGQPECQYYLKTGTCKFGATCKYHHPRDKGGQPGRVQFNLLGLPFRSGEKECAYYMRTGSCKYGVTCKFHHPQPATAFMPMPNSSLYASAGSPSAPVAQHYPAGISSWPITRGPYLASPRLQAHTSYIIPPQGIVSVAGWSTYPGPVTPMTPDGQQPTIGPAYLYGGGHQAESLGAGLQGSLGPYSPASGSIGLSTLQSQSTGGQKDLIFPERPGQPECQYYMKTGDCKFGATCRYHHPKDRATPSATCSLSPMGLPIRPGAPPCNYYTRYGICKFGPTCKFDHPLVSLRSSLSASSFTEVAHVVYPAASPLIPSAISGEVPLELGRPVLASIKDSASVSSEQAHDPLASKESFEKVDENVNLSSESGGNSQVGQSLPVQVSTSVTSISMLGNESRADIVGAS
ncbi:hypothetical protein O6H91_05G040500 [Diphasiastrum complanatum]|uniref:Uncharacterized protein n=2 Tax=Diphasiastrum complanatum TaxID=34168 RepID=A0ACC2DMT4_DIPCM|nr:hypothetical protein O6H91_05G039900 [Diphasiastrum complanatum]KAJ7555483.1 hypothetical protein O6H91_05G040500 [Diphasiastrum complanatum]